MYRKLLSLVNHFVCLRQGPFGTEYLGRILSVDPDTIELQMFEEDGTPSETWTIGLATVTEYSINCKETRTLALKVKWAASPEEEDTPGEDVTLAPSEEGSESTSPSA